MLSSDPEKSGLHILKHLWEDKHYTGKIMIHSGFTDTKEFKTLLENIKQEYSMGRNILTVQKSSDPKMLISRVNNLFSGKDIDNDIDNNLTLLTDEENYKCNQQYFNLLGDFCKECEDRLVDSDLILNEYNGSSSFDEDYTDQLLRHLHNTKGDSATFGLNALSSFCHKLESILTYSRDNRYLFSDKEFEFIFDLFGILSQLNKYTAGDFQDDVSNKEITFTGLRANAMDYYQKMNEFLMSKTDK